MNFKVFPAHLTRDGQKVPLISGWNEAASNDPAQIKLWQELFRDRIHFWGVPCGAVNGIFVLDIDVKKVNGWNTLKEMGVMIPNTLRQDTPSGGSHLIFRAHPGVHYPNSVSSKLGIDTRGDKGWIAWYGVVNNEPIQEIPEWVWHLKKPAETAPAVNAPVKVAPEIAQGIILHSLAAIREAPEGESNNVLNVESFKVGQLVASGSISREYAESELYKAAKDRGKPDYEARATIKSGLDGGGSKPIQSPFGNTAPVAGFEIPAVPQMAERWTPPFLTRHDLLNTSKLRKPQLFKDWSTEDITIVTADGGTGKTTLQLGESIALALGDRFLGFDNVQRGRTLYITGEDTAPKLGAMIGAILNQMGLLEPIPGNEEKVQTVLNSVVVKKDADLCLISKDKQGFLSVNHEAMRKILEACDDLKPKMIVLDPIASFWGSESALNDMNKAVTKFASELVEKSKCNVTMINHMGKVSSATKDMSQFAGRGGSGLPSNSRVSRVLRSIDADEYKNLTGMELMGNRTAMLCNVNKFSDGSPLYNKPFVIIRDGYLFSRQTLTVAKERELEKEVEDTERIFTFIKKARLESKWPTVKVVVAHFMNHGDPMSEQRIKRAIATLQFTGHMGEIVAEIPNPNLTIKQNALTIMDTNGKEI